MEYKDFANCSDEELFSKIYDEYSERALRFASTITCNKEIALDSVQEAFIRIYRYIRKFDKTKEFEPWFFRIVANESKRQLRKYKNTIELNDNVCEDIVPEEVENIVNIKEALTKLKFEQREILTYKYLFGYTEQEISELIKKPVGTVKSRLFKAREDLRSIVREEGQI